jgi:manganese transport protein
MTTVRPGSTSGGLSRIALAARIVGPGLLVSVGYMDPGNWATDIEAGSRFGYALLFVVLASGLAAMVLQALSLRLGLVTGRDLAQIARTRYGRRIGIMLWLIAEVAIVATDLAEVLGSALALKLLFGLPLWLGAVITGIDTLLVLGLRGRGTRRIEAIVLGLVSIITLSFLAQLIIVRPDWSAMLHGLLPSRTLMQPGALYLAIGIVGATVMPHNLYLHSSLVRARHSSASPSMPVRRMLRQATTGTVGSLAIATLVNGAILSLAACVFHHLHHVVTDIAEAYRLLAPLTGSRLAPLLFGIALLASGQSATFTGTMAGQVVLEGFTEWRLPDWMRRLVTRILALVPALIGIVMLGDRAIGTLLVASQVLLSVGLPFAILPLLRATGDPRLMGEHAAGPLLRLTGWMLLGAIAAADLWLIASSLLASI